VIVTCVKAVKPLSKVSPGFTVTVSVPIVKVSAVAPSLVIPKPVIELPKV
jgi:hypothetical protein